MPIMFQWPFSKFPTWLLSSPIFGNLPNLGGSTAHVNPLGERRDASCKGIIQASPAWRDVERRRDSDFLFGWIIHLDDWATRLKVMQMKLVTRYQLWTKRSKLLCSTTTLPSLSKPEPPKRKCHLNQPFLHPCHPSNPFKLHLCTVSANGSVSCVAPQGPAAAKRGKKRPAVSSAPRSLRRAGTGKALFPPEETPPEKVQVRRVKCKLLGPYVGVIWWFRESSW